MPTKKAAKRPRGRPAFQPTDEQRELVRDLATFGNTHEQIARVIHKPDGTPISKPTLEKAFKEELETGLILANAAVGRALYRKCVGAPAEYDDKGRLLRAEIEPHTTSQIFWAKTKMGWREVDRLELSGINGGPIEQSAVMVYLPDNGRDPSPEGTAGSVPRDTG